MTRPAKAFFAGFLTGLLGLGLSLFPPGQSLEEDVGLAWLFKLRGNRTLPPDVAIVTMDRVSSVNLDLPTDPEKWPRSLHARLVDMLTQKGASVIVFDIHFEEPRSKEEDGTFADALRKAGNTILCQVIKSDMAPVRDEKGVTAGHYKMERLVSPVAPLAEAALSLAPFPLPKVPVKVSQYWTFKTSAGDTPTLPVVALQVFALSRYDSFRQLLASAYPDIAKRLPPDKAAITGNRDPEKLIFNLRSAFKDRPSIGEDLLGSLASPSTGAETAKINKALIKMYQAPDSLFLNFYGPPGTIPTIPFFLALQPVTEAPSFDFRNKAVFVGLSERMRPEQKDGFYTVYSQFSGVDMSGVEIAATAFANLLEGLPIEPLRWSAHLTIVLLWGLLIGTGCRLLPAFPAAFSLVAAGSIYLFAAHREFSTHGFWLPLAIPLFFQAPFAFFYAVLGKYFETGKERQAIRKAMGYYLPDWAVDELARNMADVRASNKMVYGTCLFTDAGRYTTLSETMDPAELAAFMGRYYETLFRPVKGHGGIVINIVGDSMLALWSTPRPDPLQRRRACLAAIDMAAAVEHFNRSHDPTKLETRIGLHSGRILLGSVGAADHFEYRPVGDIVNTASRMEGLNKYLGTAILVSEETLEHLDGLLTRHLGEFLFVGKNQPIGVYELLRRLEEADEATVRLCRLFSEALDAYRARSWDEAIEKFEGIMATSRGDGPSSFYKKLCEQYCTVPPDEDWRGVVRLNEK